MTDINALANRVVEEIKATDEYREFAGLLAEVKKDSALYERLNELRAKNFDIQTGESEDAYDLLDALTNEFEDVINMELARGFLEAEASLCGLIQDLFAEVSNGLEFD